VSVKKGATVKLSKLIEQLKFIRIAALDAGIWEHTFLAFGSCLGAVRDGGFIEHDNDADIGYLADRFTADQEERFYKKLWDLKLFEKRHKEQRRTDNGRLLWCSLKMVGSMKTCNWFMFEHEGLLFHSKGTNWVSKIGHRLQPPPPQGIEAIAKGVPARYFKTLVEVDWYKTAWKIPGMYGSVLDQWYKGWYTPVVGCSSTEDLLLIVPKWKQKDGWFIRKR